MKRLSTSEKGFTLIEVVIVLAIAAGLILVVLLAVGGAQRSSRDTKRQTMVGQLASELEQYAANNNGAMPTKQAQMTSYLKNITDPYTSTAPQAGTATATAAAPSNWSGGYVCAAGGAMTAAKATNYAISYWNESGQSAQCKDNS